MPPTGNIYAGLDYPIRVAAVCFVFGMIFVKETHGTPNSDEAEMTA